MFPISANIIDSTRSILYKRQILTIMIIYRLSNSENKNHRSQHITAINLYQTETSNTAINCIICYSLKAIYSPPKAPQISRGLMPLLGWG